LNRLVKWLNLQAAFESYLRSQIIYKLAFLALHFPENARFETLIPAVVFSSVTTSS
jgi:hypothetical protein